MIIFYLTASQMSDHFTVLELATASSAVITNNQEIEDGGTLYYTVDGSIPDEESESLLPQESVTITGNANARALRVIGDVVESLDVNITIILNNVVSGYAIGLTLATITSLELFPVPITYINLKRSLPVKFSDSAPLVYGGAQGRGFAQTTWVLNYLSTAQYLQLYNLLNGQMSKTCYINTRLPSTNYDFALYQAVMNWPQSPEQFYDPLMNYYKDLPIEFIRMVLV